MNLRTSLASLNKSGPLLGLVVITSIALQVANFPSRYDRRDYDERLYSQSGLLVWEGIMPIVHYAPNGPETWIGWAYAGAKSAMYFVSPGTEERAAPSVLRPFVAVNHALFDIYRDWSSLRRVIIVANALIAVLAAAAAFGLGWKRGGPAAGLLVGGLTAALPLFIELSDEAKSYMMGWGLAIIALYFAAGEKPRPVVSAVAMGLAIASRIDMLMLLPLLWIDLWGEQGRFAAQLGKLARYTGIVAMVTVLAAPWALMFLLGTARAIATIRLSEPTQGPGSIKQAAVDVLWNQGLAGALFLVMAALALPSKRRWLAGLYVLLLAATMAKETGFGLRHQGGPVIAVITFAGIGVAAVAAKWPRTAWAVVAAALALPIGQAVHDVIERRADYVPTHATAWVERHVPAGTIVYLGPSLHDPLPTQAAADRLWAEVTDDKAWKRKFASAMARFHVNAAELPRALSEGDMIPERGLRREWFILGSRIQLPDPRYDIRIFADSVVFHVPDLAAEFKKTGGVLICNDADGNMPTNVGTPVVQWLNRHGRGVRIYCSADVMAQLKDPDRLAEW